MVYRDRGFPSTEFTQYLIQGAAEHIAQGRRRIAIVGQTPAGLAANVAVEALGAQTAVFDPRSEATSHPSALPWSTLSDYKPDVVVIAADAEKLPLLKAASQALDSSGSLPHVVVHGTAHQDTPDPLFSDLDIPAMVPSYATGHPHTRRHLFDCLRAASARNRTGAIIELGTFKGGTIVWLARVAQAIGLTDAPVIGFDVWNGFPARRSLLDMYANPRCVFRDVDAVRSYVDPYGVELVQGDILETVPERLADVPILLAFVDTDNYSGTTTALKVIVENLVLGGAIVFDHYSTTDDYTYTVGERIAADEVLSNRGLLHLHGTGVFVNI